MHVIVKPENSFEATEEKYQNENAFKFTLIKQNFLFDVFTVFASMLKKGKSLKLLSGVDNEMC